MTTWLVVVGLREMDPIESAMVQSMALAARDAKDLTLTRGGIEIEFTSKAEADRFAGKSRRLGAEVEVLKQD